MRKQDEPGHRQGARPEVDQRIYPQVAEPAPQPTVFGASTAAGAAAAAAMAGRGRAEEDVREDDTVAEDNGAVEEIPTSAGQDVAESR